MNPSPEGAARRRLTLLGCAGLLVVFLVQGIAFLDRNAQTFDEAVHLTAGYSCLATGDFRLNPEHPPLIKQLAALPIYVGYQLPFAPDPDLWERSGAAQWRIGQDFVYGSDVPADRLLTLGRMPNLLLGVILCGVVGWWAYRLWGRTAALVGTGLAVLDPNLVAHSCLVTFDLGITLFTFVTLYFLWEYLKSRSRWFLAAVGIGTGLALSCKFSAIILVGIVGLILGLDALRGGTPPPTDTKPARRLGARLIEAAFSVLIILLLAVLVLVPVYHFQGLSTWWDGLKYQLTHQAAGHATFLWGDYSGRFWWCYFVIAFLLKTPVGSLLLVLASFALWRRGQPLGWQEVLCLLLPPAVFFVLTTWSRLDIGLRYILPIYPFLYVAASRVVTIRLRPAWCGPLLLLLALAATAFSSLRVAPHQLAYFNELVGGPGMGYRYLGDSNLDWGQDLKGVKAYMDQEGLPMIYLSYFGSAPPAYYGIRYQYVPTTDPVNLQPPTSQLLPPETAREVLAISVMNLQGTFLQDTDRFHWLYRRSPVEKIGYSIYVYDLTGDADGHLQLAKTYLKGKLDTLAAHELRKTLHIDPANHEARTLLGTLAGR